MKISNLDPEIPKIMPRIFDNMMNLNDVMISTQMGEARKYLDIYKIKNVIE